MIGAGELLILSVIGFFVCVVPTLAVLAAALVTRRRARNRDR